MADEKITKQIKFDITDRILTGQMRAAEQTISNAAELMSQYAVDQDGNSMSLNQFLAIIDQTDEIEFWSLFAQFRAASLKKVIERH